MEELRERINQLDSKILELLNKRAKYVKVYDDEALDAFYECSRIEGIIPALETAHAIAYLHKFKELGPKENIVVNMSGRGDKDLYSIMNHDK